MTQQPRASLLGIPCELRDKIYEYVLTIDSNNKNKILPPNLGAICHQVRAETYRLYRNRELRAALAADFFGPFKDSIGHNYWRVELPLRANNSTYSAVIISASMAHNSTVAYLHSLQTLAQHRTYLSPELWTFSVRDVRVDARERDSDREHQVMYLSPGRRFTSLTARHTMVPALREASERLAVLAGMTEEDTHRHVAGVGLRCIKSTTDRMTED